ncbi:MAG: UDP-glucose/GDP-mannose dehydrogenase family protein [Prolixibacteraceae bacterium]|jgi:UDPglucose 6-dehydrogenase|nr:UDP-glucose/GDP-mannose dehydrogenase family protein [Prolixibacteraceae bacterium]
MNISIIGTGYVGLVSGVCLAETGLNVTCVDIDSNKIESLKKGEVPIYEPGLEEILIRNTTQNRLSFTTSIKDSLANCNAVFIAVGTPPDFEGNADLQYVMNVAEEIGKHLNQYLVVVTKSTVPVGTSLKVKKIIQNELKKRRVEVPFDVASNPEFLKEGNAIEDFLKPDRIIIGVETKSAENVMRKIYKPFVVNGHPILTMDIASSEMTKYTANAMLATRISFMNDIANLCELVGANVDHVRMGIGTDPRIGNKFIYPGTGYGGSCFPKDVKALIKTARDYDYSLDVLNAVEEVNNRQKTVLINKIKNYFDNEICNKTFAVWGLAFKPKTDDIREAPALVVIKELLKMGAKINVYDPIAMDSSKGVLCGKIVYCSNSYDACQNADALVIITEWAEFRTPNFNTIGKLLKNKLVFDGRNMYDTNDMRNMGFEYLSIGRNSQHNPKDFQIITPFDSASIKQNA